jgi:hypothetical protein
MKADNSNSKILNHLSADEMLALQSGNMQGEQAQRCRNHIALCALCSEAMEGVSLMPFPVHIKDIKTQWTARTSKSLKHKPLKPTHNLPIVVVITALLIFCCAYFWHFINQKQKIKSAKPTNVSGQNIKSQVEKFVAPTFTSIENKNETTITYLEYNAAKKDVHKHIESITPLSAVNPAHIEITDSAIPDIKNLDTKYNNIIYMSGLKTIDYTNLYSDEEAAKINSGLQAQFKNRDNTNAKNDILANNNTVDYRILLARAMQAIHENDNTIAIDMFDDILLVKPMDANCIFYKGIALENLNEPTNAILWFDKIIEMQTNPFLEEATFHKAVCLWNSGNKSAAKEMFLQIVHSNTFYSNQAAAYLK